MQMFSLYYFIFLLEVKFKCFLLFYFLLLLKIICNWLFHQCSEHDDYVKGLLAISNLQPMLAPSEKGVGLSVLPHCLPCFLSPWLKSLNWFGQAARNAPNTFAIGFPFSLFSFLQNENSSSWIKDPSYKKIGKKSSTFQQTNNQRPHLRLTTRWKINWLETVIPRVEKITSRGGLVMNSIVKCARAGVVLGWLTSQEVLVVYLCEHHLDAMSAKYSLHSHVRWVQVNHYSWNMDQWI